MENPIFYGMIWGANPYFWKHPPVWTRLLCLRPPWSLSHWSSHYMFPLLYPLPGRDLRVWATVTHRFVFLHSSYNWLVVSNPLINIHQIGHSLLQVQKFNPLAKQGCLTKIRKKHASNLANRVDSQRVAKNITDVASCLHFYVVNSTRFLRDTVGMEKMLHPAPKKTKLKKQIANLVGETYWWYTRFHQCLHHGQPIINSMEIS